MVDIQIKMVDILIRHKCTGSLYQGPDSDDAITGPFLDWFNLGDLSVFFIDGAV